MRLLELNLQCLSDLYPRNPHQLEDPRRKAAYKEVTEGKTEKADGCLVGILWDDSRDEQEWTGQTAKFDKWLQD
jgi:hypothetical protein